VIAQRADDLFLCVRQRYVGPMWAISNYYIYLEFGCDAFQNPWQKFVRSEESSRFLDSLKISRTEKRGDWTLQTQTKARLIDGGYFSVSNTSCGSRAETLSTSCNLTRRHMSSYRSCKSHGLRRSGRAAAIPSQSWSDGIEALPILCGRLLDR